MVSTLKMTHRALKQKRGQRSKPTQLPLPGVDKCDNTLEKRQLFQQWC